MTPSDAVRINVRVEQTLLAGEMEAYAKLYAAWSQEFGRYKTLHDRLYTVIQGETLDREELENTTAQLQVEWSYLNALQARLTDLSTQISRRMDRIAALKVEQDLARGEEATEEPLTGKWEVILNPGDQEGVFRLKQSTTLISGDYTLTGGWTGSLKGTLVGDRVRLERIDSEKGFIAVYYGRLKKEEETISGTWEATMFTTGGPMTGTWSAKKIHEP